MKFPESLSNELPNALLKKFSNVLSEEKLENKKKTNSYQKKIADII